MRRNPVLAAVLVVLATGAAIAQDVPRDLRPVIALLQPVQRATLQARARLWATWTQAQRDAFAARADEWDRRPLAERGERRAAWQAFGALPDLERRQLRDAAVQFASLDAATQRSLRAQFDELDASARHGWRLGPVLGVDYPRLQPLLAQVPADEREPLLRTLRAMNAVERDKLAVLVQRTPPAAREALRRELVSTSDANRAGWLALRLER